MNPRLHKTLMACAIAVLIAPPAWAVDDAFSSQASSMDSTDRGPPLYDHTPDELWRNEVVDVAGDKVGTVKTVVRSKDTGEAHAVITYGGIRGFGTSEIVIALDEMQRTNGKLQVNETREALHARGGYAPASYVELRPDRPISEFSAFDPLLDRH